MKIFHVKGKYKCQYCGSEFLQLSFISDIENSLFPQNVDRTFLRKNNWEIHLRLHQGMRPHLCRFCNRTFALKQVTKYASRMFLNTIEPKTKENHVRIHTGERPFNCSKCGRGSPLLISFIAFNSCSRFRQRGSLIAHERMHNKNRPFMCSQCGKVSMGVV